MVMAYRFSIVAHVVTDEVRASTFTWPELRIVHMPRCYGGQHLLSDCPDINGDTGTLYSGTTPPPTNS